MPRFRPSTCVFVLAALIVGMPGLQAPPAAAGEFLLISDVHFDPFFDGALFDRLDAQPVEKWADILEQSKPAGFNPRGTDSNFALLRSSLEEAGRRNPRPDFILYPGDFLAHQWQAKYDRLAGKSHIEDPEAYRAFTSKVVRFLASEFRRAFPQTAVLPTLGNDDSYCGDYMIEPEGPFLAMFADVWAPLLGPEQTRGSFRESFPVGGYYSMRLPQTRRGRLIVLNSVLFSVNYNDACGSKSRTPALDQLRWFDETLARAEADGENVWLLMHVPPGINSFNSAENAIRGSPPESFWERELTGRFLQIVDRHLRAIGTAFAGHTHMDDYRVVRLDGEPALLCKIAPAVSPIFGNNPGYQVYQYDREGGTPENFQTYYLTDLESQPKSDPASGGRWALEYDFRNTYGEAAPTARGIERLAAEINSDAATRRSYITYYGVSAAPEITARTLPVYRCAIANITAPDFLSCLNGSPKPARPTIFPDRRPAALPLTRP